MNNNIKEFLDTNYKKSNVEIIEYLKDRHLLHKYRACSCKSEQHQATVEKRTTVDEIGWRCGKFKRRVPLRYNTFWNFSKITFRALLTASFHVNLKKVAKKNSTGKKKFLLAIFFDLWQLV